MKYLRGKSLQRRKEMKGTVASALETKGARVGYEVCCVRVGLTQRTMNNQNGWRLQSGFVCEGGMCKSWVAKKGVRCWEVYFENRLE